VQAQFHHIDYVRQIRIHKNKLVFEFLAHNGRLKIYFISILLLLILSSDYRQIMSERTKEWNPAKQDLISTPHYHVGVNLNVNP